MLSYPRLDAATGQVRVPSHYLLRVAEALTGQAVDYDRLSGLVQRIPVGRLASADHPLSPGEWDLAAVVHAIKARDPSPIAGLPGCGAIARGTLAEASRWGRPVVTEYDGALGIPVPLPPIMAATHAETYGTCPFRFFGDRVLGVREIDEPEAVETISPVDRGALLHEILEKFFTGLVKDGLVPIHARHLDEYRHRLRFIAQGVFAEFEQSGAVGYAFMWEVEKTRMLTDLEGALANELAGDQGYAPRYFEARFGPSPPWVQVSPGSSPEPLELPVEGRALRFAGKIDRIDIGPQGARVIDYKTGRVYEERDNKFRGAQSLQLPLYLLAADSMLEHHGLPVRAQEALYYYATGKGRYQRVYFTRAALDARSSEFTTILNTIAAGIEQGVFPQHPGGDGDNCTWCEFKRVCGHGRVRLVDRKAHDPQLAALRSMWEIE
jgi:RecB family exonuclease